MKEGELWREHYRVVSLNPDPQSPKRVDFRERYSQNIRDNPNSSSSKLSVVIPAFEEENRIERLLSSLNCALSETKVPTEIIVVDNNSSDQTAQISRDFGVTVVREPLRGVANARQAGLEAVNQNSIYVLTTDADCIVPQNWINTHHAHLSKPDVTFTYGGVKYAIDQNVDPLNRTLFTFFLIARETFRGMKRVLIKDFISASGANSGFKKDEALQAGGYHRNLAALEDFFLTLDLQKSTGGKLVPVNAPVIGSARRIIGSGVMNYIRSRLDFSINYFVYGKLDQPVTYATYR